MITQPEKVRSDIDLLVLAAQTRFVAGEDMLVGAWGAAIPEAKIDEATRRSLRTKLAGIVSWLTKIEEESLIESSFEVIEASGMIRNRESDDYLGVRVDFTGDRLAAKILADSRLVAEAMNRTLLAAHMEGQVNNLPEEERIRRAYLTEKTRLNLGYTNRGGRRMATDHFLRTTLMDHYYLALNDYSVDLLTAKGQSEGVIDAPGHDYHGRRIALVEYPDLRDEVFHPQSIALILQA